MTGRGCCPACVQLLSIYKLLKVINSNIINLVETVIGESCDIRSKLRRCHGGLYCDPETNQCDSLHPKTRCTKEADNRRLVQNSGMVLYVKGDQKGAPVYFEIPFATDMDMVSCDAESGHYELKQCRDSKLVARLTTIVRPQTLSVIRCFCVEPESGQYTFGMTVKDSATESAENVTCQCSQYFHERLVKGRVDKDYMEFHAQVHQKCDSSGNFEPLQCINQTCFCVDVKTGKPEFGHVAMYGALSTLPCCMTLILKFIHKYIMSYQLTWRGLSN